ncbi:hypothetical protein BVW01_02630, partial [Mycobacterium tuberculosis]
GERTREGFYRTKNGIEPCIARAKAYAPFADLIWHRHAVRPVPSSTTTPECGRLRGAADRSRTD